MRRLEERADASPAKRQGSDPLHEQSAALCDLLGSARRWLVLTGAGCSTDSGIPDYRDQDGRWKRSPPMQYQEFMGQPEARKRYWARSMVGWVPFGRARPGTVHRQLAELEQAGRISALVTQNVDGLHQAAGSSTVVDLHGSLSQVDCTACGAGLTRSRLQDALERLNPEWTYAAARIAPDGDVDLEGVDYKEFAVPDCPICGGILKPAVVFFGESVPRERVRYCMDQLAESDALFVVGSSLMVFSGYRFVREATRLGIPVVILNQGRTRGDEDATVKLESDCAAGLSVLLSSLR